MKGAVFFKSRYTATKVRRRRLLLPKMQYDPVASCFVSTHTTSRDRD